MLLPPAVSAPAIRDYLGGLPVVCLYPAVAPKAVTAVRVSVLVRKPTTVDWEVVQVPIIVAPTVALAVIE